MKTAKRAKGFKTLKIIRMMVFALAFAGVFVGHVWKQNTYIRLSLDASQFEKRKTKLLGDVALLELEVGDLRKPERIERLAREKFGLEYGATPILVYSENESGESGTEAERRAIPTGDRGRLETAGAQWPTNGL